MNQDGVPGGEQKLTDFRYTLVKKLTGFDDAVDTRSEEKRGIKDGSKNFQHKSQLWGCITYLDKEHWESSETSFRG